MKFGIADYNVDVIYSMYRRRRKEKIRILDYASVAMR